MNAIRNALGRNDNGSSSSNGRNNNKNHTKPKTSFFRTKGNNNSTKKVDRPLGSAAPTKGVWSKPFQTSSDAPKTKDGRSGNGTLTTNKPTSSLSPTMEKKTKATGSHRASSRFVPSPKRATRTVGVSKGYISSGPTYSASLKAEDLYKNVPTSKWKVSLEKFAGSMKYDEIGEQESVTGKSISSGIKHFKKNPGKYIALMYQTDVEGWPEKQQKYTLIHRQGTVRFEPQGLSSKGWMTILVQNYQHLPSFKDNILPKQYRDAYTDGMIHHKRKLHTKNNPPILPGRGMGVGDTPLLKLIGDIDPSDIHQGAVGDCWLLSAISALAEFDGAVKKLFRKTKNLERLPLETPNQYVVTLWDLPTWKEVDIVLDERLAAMPDGSGTLLASKPSEDGELWVCYLEKALAIHCGGWDKITGGQCSHAWSLMTGCRDQYTIRKNPKTGKYACFSKFDIHKAKWADHYNSPKENNSTMWRVPWPKVGGGGGVNLELTEKELFQKFYAFDQHNFIVAAGTNGTSDKHLTDGMVDNHAYSVIEAVSNAAGTGIDLFRVRNPWGKGEIENGEFDDDGPGWDKYPQIKKLLKPVVADDGIFWLTRQEFFRLFNHMYVSASDMTNFLED